jgi:hypothetical protein
MEVHVRLITAAVGLLAVVLLGHLGSGVSAQSDPTPAGVRTGDVIRVTFPPTISGALFKCTVTAVRDGFVRCQEEEPGAGQNQGPVTWHNLRLAWHVSVTPRDALAIR